MRICPLFSTACLEGTGEHNRTVYEMLSLSLPTFNRPLAQEYVGKETSIAPGLEANDFDGNDERKIPILQSIFARDGGTRRKKG